MRTLYMLVGVMLLWFAAPTHAQWNSGANCPAGTIDTMGWAYPYPALRQSNGWWSHGNHQTYASHPADWAMGEISTSQGGAIRGATWELTSIDANGHGLGGDLQRWNANYIYYWSTGGGADTSPTYPSPYYSHTMFDRLIPSMKRCETPGYPGDVIVTKDSYLYITDGTPACQYTADSPVHFGKIRMAFYGPYQIQFGAQSAPQTTYMINYKWGWNPTTRIYENREQEYYQQPQGFTEWVGMHWDYTLQGYVVDTNINEKGKTIQHISDFSAVQPGQVLSQNIGCANLIPRLFGG